MDLEWEVLQLVFLPMVEDMWVQLELQLLEVYQLLPDSILIFFIIGGRSNRMMPDLGFAGSYDRSDTDDLASLIGIVVIIIIHFVY